MIAITQSALLLLAHHSDVQAKLLLELSRSPIESQSDFITASEDQLPFLTAFIMEAHRFRPVVNIINHSPLKDDTYEGDFIPKGAQVACNVWSICHDNALYEDPSSFRPSRFLDDGTGRPREGIQDPRRFTFGFGRRDGAH